MTEGVFSQNTGQNNGRQSMSETKIKRNKFKKRGNVDWKEMDTIRYMINQIGNKKWLEKSQIECNLCIFVAVKFKSKKREL